MVKLDEVYQKVEDNWVSRFILDEVVIMPLCRSEEDLQYIYSISNETGSRIWQLLDGEHRVRDIQEILKAEYQGQSELIEREALEFIEDFLGEGLIEQAKQGEHKLQITNYKLPAKKKPYQAPEIAKVQMQPEQAVLSCCTVNAPLKQHSSAPTVLVCVNPCQHCAGYPDTTITTGNSTTPS